MTAANTPPKRIQFGWNGIENIDSSQFAISIWLEMLFLYSFKMECGTKKTVLLTFIAAYGLTSNEYSMQLVHDALDMDALFE